MEALVGNSFVDKSGKTLTLADVVKPDTKAVALYFSAHVSSFLTLLNQGLLWC